MDAPKPKSSIILPALGLIGAVAARMTIELFAPRPGNVSAPQGSTRKQSPEMTGRHEDATGRPPKAATGPTREQRIRERAFWIWMEEGRPQGRDEEHWRRAEAEIPE
jgi:hypothetical protein